MSLENIKRMKSEKGFTIVELLIVIVIIGILAAIVIVAYQGITSRANDSNYKADAVSIGKVAEAINADNGSYPQSQANLDAYTGANLPAGVKIFFPTTTPPTNVVTVGATTSAPAVTAVGALYKTSDGVKYYAAKACGSSTGMNIYYPQTVSGGTLGTLKVGVGC